jgi:hypothetical protein
MTPNLVATTALIDLDHPSWAASGLPGVKDDANRAYGAYAAGVWLQALQPTIRKKTWTWPSPDSVPGSEVPDVRGMTLDEAKSELKNSHYKMRQLDAADTLQCASRRYTAGEVAYYAPQIAPRGATITVCPTSGEHQDIWTPPPPPPPPTSSSNPPSSGSSGGPSSPPSGGTSTTPPAGGGSSSTPPPGGGGPSSGGGGVLPSGPPGGGHGHH